MDFLSELTAELPRSLIPVLLLDEASNDVSFPSFEDFPPPGSDLISAPAPLLSCPLSYNN